MPESTRLKRSSLRTRIVALATVAVTIVLIVGGWLLGTALRRGLVDDLAGAAAVRSQDLATLATQGTLPRPVPIGDADEAMVQVVARGRVVASSTNVTGEPPLAVPPPRAGMTTVVRLPALPITDEEDEGGFLVAMTSRTAPDDQLLTVYVASSLEDVAEAVAEATRLGLLALPILVVVLAAGIWVLVGRTLAPVDAIRAEADAITGSGLDRRVPQPRRNDEIGRLASTLNSMLDRLEESAARQRRFVADAAHELRTPVASARTVLETARSSSREIDWDAVSADTLADTIRMQQLTEQLLLLARVDAGRLQQRMDAVDLDDVVAQVVARHENAGEVDVDVAHLEPLQVIGDRILLEQAVLNLLDNAHAHARTRVEIAVGRDDGGVALTVDDDGPGIPPNQRTAIFERFTRLDAARVRDRTGGAGLGLAIVADIIAAHLGTVTAEESPLGGARLQVRLPGI